MNLPEAIENIRPSIVQVMFFASGFSDEIQRKLGKPFIAAPLGTGFFVHRDGYVVTANHVVEAGNRLLEKFQAQEGKKKMQVGIAHTNTENMRGNFSVVDFSLTDTDPRHDLALLKLRNNPLAGEWVHSGNVVGGREIPLVSRLPMINDRRPREGVSVAVSGYPLLESVLVTNSGHIASVWAYNMPDEPVPGAPEWFRIPDIADNYLIDTEANSGNSGGPAYLVDNGEVIGVCVGTKPAPVTDQQGEPVTIDGKKLSYGSGLTVVAPAQYVIALVEQRIGRSVNQSC